MKSGRVAIVDDDPAIRSALTRLVRSLDYEPLLFENAPSFLAAFDTIAPDCVVTDVQMPDINGFELLRTLKRRRPALPVIVITAYSSGANRDRALNSGAYAFLPKPFTSDEFERCLSTVMNKRT